MDQLHIYDGYMVFYLDNKKYRWVEYDQGLRSLYEFMSYSTNQKIILEKRLVQTSGPYCK